MNARFNLNFQAPNKLVTQDSPNWRPPSFPPPDDFVVTVDSAGEPLERYGDDLWDFRPLVGYHAVGYNLYNFASRSLSKQNKKLVKQAFFFALYHPRLFPGSIGGCSVPFLLLMKIAEVCDKHDILISQLSRFAKIHEEIAEYVLTASTASGQISWLHKFLAHSDELGFVIADERSVAFLASRTKNHTAYQYPYIPPRIWSYQVNRLNEVLDTFLDFQDQIHRLFDWVDMAYDHNQSSGLSKQFLSPFSASKSSLNGRRVVYKGTFDDCLKGYGLYDVFNDLIKRTEDPRRGYGSLYILGDLVTYLNKVRDCALAFILTFSLQRRAEVSSLRADCFTIEKDEKLGAIGLIFGETTKTEEDSDARWVVPTHVKKAVDVASSIAKLRIRHYSDIADDLKNNPYLSMAGLEPWSTGNKAVSGHKQILRLDRLYDDLAVFDQDALVATEEDWRVACAITPDLLGRPELGVGKVWKITPHQLRRTLAVNLFSSEQVSLPSVQWAMKHVSRDMTLYYGRNYTNLRLNSGAERTVILEQYKSIYRQLCSTVEGVDRHVNPHGREMVPGKVVNLIEAREEAKLIKMVEKGEAGCRTTRLGSCMKPGACKYGGIESIAHCAGYGGKGICADAKFDQKHEVDLRATKVDHENELASLSDTSPRSNHLKAEIYAIEVYLNAIKSQNS